MCAVYTATCKKKKKLHISCTLSAANEQVITLHFEGQDSDPVDGLWMME